MKLTGFPGEWEPGEYVLERRGMAYLEYEVLVWEPCDSLDGHGINCYCSKPVLRPVQTLPTGTD